MIQIITDSAADFTPAEAKEKGIEIIPLKIIFGEQVFYQEQDEGFHQFYSLLASAKQLPSTSQATPHEYEALFEQARDAGGGAVVITLSGKLSGTVQSAHMAKKICGYHNIHIVDSKQAVIGQRLLVEYAVRLREQGKSADDIAAAVEDAAGRVRLWGMVDTLDYLLKGGRLSRGAAMVGSMLNIKPIIEIRDGGLVMADKARGFQGSAQSIFRMMGDVPAVDPAAPVYFGYSHVQDSCLKFRELAMARYHFSDCPIYPVGGIVGTHIGPGAMIIAYLQQK